MSNLERVTLVVCNFIRVTPSQKFATIYPRCFATSCQTDRILVKNFRSLARCSTFEELLCIKGHSNLWKILHKPRPLFLNYDHWEKRTFLIEEQDDYSKCSTIVADCFIVFSTMSICKFSARNRWRSECGSSKMAFIFAWQNVFRVLCDRRRNCRNGIITVDSFKSMS